MKSMKRDFAILFTTGALMAALTGGLSFARAQSTNSAAPAPGAGTGPTTAALRQTAVYKAITALLAAKREMSTATHDYGGHKKDAMDACTKAMTQLELALEALKNEKK
jgi:hypothetical protein